MLDYLLEEVLRTPARTIFKLSCCAHPFWIACAARSAKPFWKLLPASGQETLEDLERANLFIVPLDNERRWYRYHHLFGDLLRQRLGQPQELSELSPSRQRVV